MRYVRHVAVQGFVRLAPVLALAYLSHSDLW
jgi:hypothetical protein